MLKRILWYASYPSCGGDLVVALTAYMLAWLACIDIKQLMCCNLGTNISPYKVIQLRSRWKGLACLCNFVQPTSFLYDRHIMSVTMEKYEKTRNYSLNYYYSGKDFWIDWWIPRSGMLQEVENNCFCIVLIIVYTYAFVGQNVHSSRSTLPSSSNLFVGSTIKRTPQNGLPTFSTPPQRYVCSWITYLHTSLSFATLTCYHNRPVISRTFLQKWGEGNS